MFCLRLHHDISRHAENNGKYNLHKALPGRLGIPEIIPNPGNHVQKHRHNRSHNGRSAVHIQHYHEHNRKYRRVQIDIAVCQTKNRIGEKHTYHTADFKRPLFIPGHIGQQKCEKNEDIYRRPCRHHSHIRRLIRKTCQRKQRHHAQYQKSQ